MGYLEKDIQYPLDVNIKQQDVIINFKNKCIEQFKNTKDFIDESVF